MFKRNISAVSLIEVVIAMVIGSIVLTSVYMVYYFTNKSNSVGFERMEAQQSLNMAIDQIMKDLRCAGYKVSTQTCGISKEDSINRARRTELIIYGDFEDYSTEDPTDPSTTLIERVHYFLVNDNKCLVRAIYEESPDNTWDKHTEKVLIGNNRPNGNSRVCIGEKKIPAQNNDFGFSLRYYDSDDEEITTWNPGINVTLTPAELQNIRKVDISINITDEGGAKLSYAITSTGMLRNLVTSE